MNLIRRRAFVSGRSSKFSARTFRALLEYFLTPRPMPVVDLQPSISNRRGRTSFLRPAGHLHQKAKRGYSIPWHSGKVPIPTVGHSNLPRLTPDGLKAYRALANTSR